MGENSCPLGKYGLMILTGSGFHLHHIKSFLFIFCPGQLFSHQKEMDGPVSALLLTGELESRQFWFTLGLCWCKGSAQLVHKNVCGFWRNFSPLALSGDRPWGFMVCDGWVRAAVFLQLQMLKHKCDLMMRIVSNCVIPWLQRVDVVPAYLFWFLPAHSHSLGTCRGASEAETFLSFYSPSPCACTCPCSVFYFKGGF